jgi:hypothetical protein
MKRKLPVDRPFSMRMQKDLHRLMKERADSLELSPSLYVRKILMRELLAR